MGAGVRTPTLRRGEIGVAAIVVAFWLAAPAHAQAPLDPVAVAVQSPAATAVPAVEASQAFETTAVEASRSVEDAVAGAAEAVTGSETHPTVDSALRAVTAAAPPAVGSGIVAGPRPEADRGQAKASSRASGARSRRTPVPHHAGAASRQARPVGPPAGPATTREVGGASQGIVAGSVLSEADLVPSLGAVDAPSGAIQGSPASAAATAVSVGGLAVLLTALFLAAPGLRRRLPDRRAICPSAAFVPLLERPG
jgi:hypothetical protein